MSKMNFMSNKQKLYLYAVLLFIMAFTLTTSLISSIKTNTFDYFRLITKAILLIFCIVQIVHHAKIENADKK